MSTEPRILAFYLPQYHTFPKNDAWWGKGFTEWINVKKAKPLYKGHAQPRIPLDNNYYDLLNSEVLVSQMKLAKRFGLYGFCYYHYWFDGKLLLQRPLENMLKMSDKIPYCFCWANEPWTRSWDGRSQDVLMPQRYGREKEWEEHFQYLLNFFKDQFYIKVDNKPFLVLYRTNNIPHCDEMISYWDKRCKEELFSGIYISEELNAFQDRPVCMNSNAIVEFEPMYTITYRRKFTDKVRDKSVSTFENYCYHNNICFRDFNRIQNGIINQRYDFIKNGQKKIYYGSFTGWDNSPRKGKNAMIVKCSSPEKFHKYMVELLKRAQKEGSEFVFINAWNEWGEGAYLEPDEQYGYGYLEALKAAIEEVKK